VRKFIVSTLNVQTQGTMAQLTKHKRFQRSFELFEGDVRLPKLFRQTVTMTFECMTLTMSPCHVDLVISNSDKLH